MVTYLDEESFAHYNVRRFEVKPVDHCSHYSQVSVVWYQYIAICHHVDLLFFLKKKQEAKNLVTVTYDLVLMKINVILKYV